MNFSDDARVEDITPEDIRLYLQGNNWEETDVVDEFLSVWKRSDVRRELFVPRTTRADDYNSQLTVIAHILSKDEGRDTRQVLADMRHMNSDVIRLRIDTTAFDRGTIGFEKAADIIAATHGMLGAAARAAIAPQNHFTAPRPPSEVSDYLSATRLGQTEPGSFIFTVISPVIFSHRFEREHFFFASNNVDEKAKLPFARRVTQTLAKSVQAIRGAAHFSQRSLTSVFEDLVDDGVSANLCDALSEISEQSNDHVVDLDFAWSAKADAPNKVFHERIIVPAIITPALKDMSNHLKAVVPEQNFEVIGRVDRLLNQRDSDGFDLYLRATINSSDRLVAIPLANEQRQIASQAWKTGQGVSIRGTLDRRFRPYRLLQSTALQLLGQI